MGATVKNNVSRKTDMLIVGKEPGVNKYKDALRKGVPIIPWPMFINLGLFEERSGKQFDFEEALANEILLNMVTITDSCYAHFLSRRDLRYYRAYELGRTAVVRLLRATWGPPTAGDDEDGDDLLGSPCQTSFDCLSGAFGCWMKLIKILKEISNEAE